MKIINVLGAIHPNVKVTDNFLWSIIWWNHRDKSTTSNPLSVYTGTSVAQNVGHHLRTDKAAQAWNSLFCHTNYLD